MHLVASVCPSVSPSVRPFVCQFVQHRAKKTHCQSKVFVCVSNNCADAVDQLLIIWCKNQFAYNLAQSQLKHECYGKNNRGGPS